MLVIVLFIGLISSFPLIAGLNTIVRHFYNHDTHILHTWGMVLLFPLLIIPSGMCLYFLGKRIHKKLTSYYTEQEASLYYQRRYLVILSTYLILSIVCIFFKPPTFVIDKIGSLYFHYYYHKTGWNDSFQLESKKLETPRWDPPYYHFIYESKNPDSFPLIKRKISFNVSLYGYPHHGRHYLMEKMTNPQTGEVFWQHIND